MIELYGGPRTSAGRCYLTLEELTLDYRAVPVDMFKAREHKLPKYLKLNPNGRVPCLIDGDLVLWESVAITQYLVDRYRPTLLGRDAAERGLVAQWTWWAMTELQPPLVDLLIQTKMKSAEERDHALVEACAAKIPAMLRILDDHLSDCAYIIGEVFTLADINVFSVFNMTTSVDIATTEYTHVTKWASRLKERPSVRRWLELRGQPLN